MCIATVFVPKVESGERADVPKVESYLEDLLMCRVVLERYKAVQNNQLHIVVTLLDDQVNVARSCSLKQIEEKRAI